ncbi:MAG: protein-L-isoaspartate O-methyltransferase [Caedibacter sp. 37-49]|nr:MAG: protein-L-isoaspartate O-methyltransferase [Caedibacter sp. 37-49]
MLVQKIDYQKNDHAQMVEFIKQGIRDTAHLTGVSDLSLEVEQALLKVPRAQFVSKELKEFAYFDEALPIGCGQTISQPLIVALMTELIQPHRGQKVLEIGTGTGYQSAVLAQIVKEVYTIEIIPELSLTAQRHFNECEYKNIYPLIGSGAEGWLEYAPYDGILITAACDTIPHALLDQLSPNGHMVIPLGGKGRTQMLTLVKKDANGQIHEKAILPVAFVPFT